MDSIIGNPVLGTCGHFFHPGCIARHVQDIHKAVDAHKERLGDVDEYDDRWADLLRTHERALAEEAVDALQEMTNTNSEILACPACPRCKVPGAFFKMYTRS